MPLSVKPRGRGILIVVAVYILLILFFSSDSYITSGGKGGSLRFPTQLLFYAERWLSWALLTPLIVWTARRPAFSLSRWPIFVGWHLIGGLAFTLLQNLTYLGLRYFDIIVGLRESYIVGQFAAHYLKNYQYNFLTYVVIVGITLAADSIRRSRENELRAAQLENRLAGAELQALRMQVHPHFLFNTLHAVSALVHKNPDAADRMITRLSDMFRLSLESSKSREISLREELQTLKPYLEIMDMRFGDRLRVRLDCPEDTLDALVPNLILQPLLENSIQHGIAPKPEGGTVTVRGRRHGDRLRLEIADDGPGFAGEPGEIPGNGLGLSSTQERLKLLYRDDHRFILGRSDEGGALVVMDIPFKAA